MQLSTAPAREHWSSSVWPQLLPELAERIVGFMDRNDLAATFRQVNKATAEHFSSPQHITIYITEPVPPHTFTAHWLAPGATRGLTLERRWKLVRLVAASGLLPNLEVALQAAGFTRAVAEAFNAAAGAGQLQTCQWLWEYSRSHTEDFHDAVRADDALKLAAGGGHRHVCEWLLALERHKDALHVPVAIVAATGGHADLAEWLLQKCTPRAEQSAAFLRAVAHGCDLLVLQRAWLRFGPASLDMNAKEALLAHAACSPTPDWAAKVEWLDAQGCSLGAAGAGGAASTYETAASLPDDGEALARLTWLRRRGYEINEAAVLAAACNGNTAALRYLLAEMPTSEVTRYDTAACGLVAAQAGHLAALQALHAAGSAISVTKCAIAAASGGHLHVLTWLLEGQWGMLVERLMMEEALIVAAAESGSVELLAWLRQHGCPWDCEVLLAAVKSGCEAALEWLVQQGCPMEVSEAAGVGIVWWVREDGFPYTVACRDGDLAMARCLRRLGVPWGPAGRVIREVAEWTTSRPVASLPVVRWLLQEGYPVDH
ncbi:hypothetical protein GPECTOR_438g320 [Gonium pectorale]|uniref:Uncharacterized protein n=1 Tax=Gonium pectorale TaxID=33097 RepID=A0A150FV55_GONPE|nr:hypothetical protein GPECTOR_438g320 [Gonium pectorale]|eukprot:KXZ41486.1 hypothetical protein GPECTOR_438g320 [Gonium pectorale]